MNNTKEKILKKTVELFFGHGIKETTMDHIAADLGISKKTLYKYFATKDELVREAVGYLSNKINVGIDQINRRELNPYEAFFQIRQMINDMVKQVNLTPFKQMKIYYPELAKTMEEKRRKKIFEFLDNNFDKGIQLGFYKKNLDRDFFKRMFLGCKQALFDTELFPPDMLNTYKNHLLFLKLYLQAISTKKGKKELKKILKKYEV